MGDRVFGNKDLAVPFILENIVEIVEKKMHLGLPCDLFYRLLESSDLCMSVRQFLSYLPVARPSCSHGLRPPSCSQFLCARCSCYVPYFIVSTLGLRQTLRAHAVRVRVCVCLWCLCFLSVCCHLLLWFAVGVLWYLLRDVPCAPLRALRACI
jgi:hypothetical protein